MLHKKNSMKCVNEGLPLKEKRMCGKKNKNIVMFFGCSFFISALLSTKHSYALTENELDNTVNKKYSSSPSLEDVEVEKFDAVVKNFGSIQTDSFITYKDFIRTCLEVSPSETKRSKELDLERYLKMSPEEFISCVICENKFSSFIKEKIDSYGVSKFQSMCEFRLSIERLYSMIMGSENEYPYDYMKHVSFYKLLRNIRHSICLQKTNFVTIIGLDLYDQTIDFLSKYINNEETKSYGAAVCFLKELDSLSKSLPKGVLPDGTGLGPLAILKIASRLNKVM